MTTFHQAQKEIARDTHRFRVVCAGRRFGKTLLAVWELFGKAISKNDLRVAYIAPTYQQARDIAWQELKKVSLPLVDDVNESRLEIRVKTKNGGTSTIFLRGWESVETLRGQSFDLIVIDEVAMMRYFWENWQEVVSPTLTDRAGHALFISTPRGFNHFYDLFNLENDQKLGKDFKSFHFTSYDNPHLPKDEIERQKVLLTEDRFAQEFMADFRKQEGLVYKEFDRKKHLIDSLTNKGYIAEVLVGVDFGYTNPSAVIKIERNADNKFYITEEWYKSGKTTEEIIEMAKAMRANAYYPDPAEPDRIELMNRAALNCREVIKDIPRGVDAVRELLKQDRLFIHKDCKNLIEEIESYRYPDKRPDNNEPERPVKENDHALDAMRYVLVMQAPAQLATFEEDNFELYSSKYN